MFSSRVQPGLGVSAGARADPEPSAAALAAAHESAMAKSSSSPLETEARAVAHGAQRLNRQTCILAAGFYVAQCLSDEVCYELQTRLASPLLKTESRRICNCDEKSAVQNDPASSDTYNCTPHTSCSSFLSALALFAYFRGFLVLTRPDTASTFTCIYSAWKIERLHRAQGLVTYGPTISQQTYQATSFCLHLAAEGHGVLNTCHSSTGAAPGWLAPREDGVILG